MIRTRGLRKTFGTLDAVQGLDLNVKEGSATALVGANGAGKSTTIRVIMNLLQPDSGSAEVLGKDSRRLSPEEFKRIGYVAESQKLPAAMKLGEFLSYLATAERYFPEGAPPFSCFDTGSTHTLPSSSAPPPHFSASTYRRQTIAKR